MTDTAAKWIKVFDLPEAFIVAEVGYDTDDGEYYMSWRYSGNIGMMALALKKDTPWTQEEFDASATEDAARQAIKELQSTDSYFTSPAP